MKYLFNSFAFEILNIVFMPSKTLFVDLIETKFVSW